MTIPTLPSAPLVTDIPADFNTKAFNWVAALDNWTTEANATGVAADADAATATSAAGTATTQAGTATTQAGIATSAASTATTQAGIATTKAGEANASAVAAAASAASINLNSIDINGGTIDGTVIGGSSAAAGSFTTLSASDSIRGGSGATYKFALDYSVSGDVAGELANSHASGYGYRIKGGTTSNYALLVQSQDSTNILEAKKGSVAVTGAVSASGKITANGTGGVAAIDITDATSNVGLGLRPSGVGNSYITTTRAGSHIYVRTSAVSEADTTTLDISSTGLAVTGAVSVAGSGLAANTVLLNGTTTGANYARFTSSGADGVLGIESSTGTTILSGSSGNATVLYTVNATPLQFGTNSVTRATLDASGNLGLGVTPSATWTGLRTLETANGVTFSGQSNLPIAHITANATLNASAVWTYNTTNDALRYELQADTGNHSWYTAPSGTAGNAITFTQAMTLDSLGRLIVGTTTPAGMITADGQDVYYSAYLTQGAAASNCLALHNRATTGDNAFAVFGTEASVTARGSITYNRGGGLVAYNTTSDYRAKDVYGPVLDSGSQVDALKVYRGKMKGATMERPMLIAHEAQEVAPYAVSGVKDAINEDGTPLFQQVDTSSLVPLLIAEIQSLRQRLATAGI